MRDTKANSLPLVEACQAMLLSDDLFKRKLVELSPSLSEKKLTLEIINDIGFQIGRFLLIQVFTSAVVGVVTWAALWYMGLKQAALWGLLAGIFNSIPYYGPLIVSAGLAIVALLQFGTIGMTLAVAGVAMVITTLEGSLLTPVLMGKVASMNRVMVFVTLVFWSWVWGVWGMLLAVPIMIVDSSQFGLPDRANPMRKIQTTLRLRF